jgi:GT2 family glycosyltransferase
MSFGCIVLTQGKRPQELGEALASLQGQAGVELDIVVVGNGWAPSGLPEGVLGVELEVDAGIPGGRNAGVAHVAGELLFFLDDDAALAEPDALARVAAKFAVDPELGVVQLRVDPSSDGPPERRWVPRPRVGDRMRSSEVTHVWEGAVVIRRDVFDAIAGWPAEFRFVHEGVDLGWRVMDAGYRIQYAGDIAALHPPYASHNDWDDYYGARNRVWLARRYLPWPLAISYVATFAARTLPLLGSRRRRSALRGYRDGLTDNRERRPLKRATIVRMTRLGSPPVI